MKLSLQTNNKSLNTKNSFNHLHVNLFTIFNYEYSADFFHLNFLNA